MKYQIVTGYSEEKYETVRSLYFLFHIHYIIYILINVGNQKQVTSNESRHYIQKYYTKFVYYIFGCWYFLQYIKTLKMSDYGDIGWNLIKEVLIKW